MKALFPEQSGEVTPGTFWTSAAVRLFLARAHPPVNDIGVELASVVDGAAPRYARPSLTWLPVVEHSRSLHTSW